MIPCCYGYGFYQVSQRRDSAHQMDKSLVSVDMLLEGGTELSFKDLLLQCVLYAGEGHSLMTTIELKKPTVQAAL